MLYCPKCSRLTVRDACPSCQKSKKLRAPQDNEPVLLLTVRHMHASMIEPLLEEEKIPHSRVDLMGWGSILQIGTMLESYQFFVPYAAYSKAVELIGGIFAEDAEIMRALRDAVGAA